MRLEFLDFLDDLTEEGAVQADGLKKMGVGTAITVPVQSPFSTIPTPMGRIAQPFLIPSLLLSKHLFNTNQRPGHRDEGGLDPVPGPRSPSPQECTEGTA